MSKEDQQRSAEEIARRRDQTIRNLIATPPSPHKEGIKNKSPLSPRPGRPPKD